MKLHLRFLLLVTLLFVIIYPLRSQDTLLRSEIDSLYTLVWEDNFDSLDLYRWEVKDEFDQWGTHFVCLKENVSVTDSGYLKLDLRKQNYTCSKLKTSKWHCRRQSLQAEPSRFVYRFTAANIKSKCGYEADFGYMEARIALPPEKGSSSCFWTTDTDCDTLGKNAGEIDIVEVWSRNYYTFFNNRRDEFYTNVHLSYDGSIPNPVGGQVFSIYPDSITNFHIYALEWDQDSMNFYYDGILVRAISNPGVASKVDILFNNWLHDSWFYNAGFRNDKLSRRRYNDFPDDPVSMYVDWVRVYTPIKP